MFDSLTSRLNQFFYPTKQRSSRRRKLCCELLNSRQMLAGDYVVMVDDDHPSIDNAFGEISYDAINLRASVDGSALDDTLLVHEDPAGGISLTYVSGDNGMVHVRHFPAGDVEEVVFHGNDGDDTFQNFSSVASDVYGDQGHDTLIGGSGQDVMRGGEGNDDLFGNGGIDDLRGNRGDDDLFGGDAGDTLEGGRGNDELFGGNGPDRLLGGQGNDELFGEGGRDSLFGDAGSDLLQGDNGADRFLKHYEIVDGIPILVNEDTIVDKSNADVTVRFEDTSSATAHIGGLDYQYSAGFWSASEIETIDLALAELVAVRRDNSFLVTDIGNELTFYRTGEGSATDIFFDYQTVAWVEIEVDANFAGWNRSGGEGIIYFTDEAFSSPEWTIQTTFHEIAHEWDTENPDWGEFKALSAWTIDAYWMESSGLQQSTNGEWWHDPNASFARSYGMSNPMEDFATTYAKYMMDLAGLSYIGTQVGSDLTPKLDFMDDFILG
ncbi:MAG: calcium-binding protein [Planctomycetota bacterium]